MVQCQISRNLVNNSYLNKRNNEFNSKVNNFNNIDDINKAKKIMIELIERNKKDIETINSLQTNIDETDIKDINEELKKYKKSVENTNNFILSNKKRLSETKKIGYIHDTLAVYRLHNSNLSKKRIALHANEMQGWIRENKKKGTWMEFRNIYS